MTFDIVQKTTFQLTAIELENILREKFPNEVFEVLDNPKVSFTGTGEIDESNLDDYIEADVCGSYGNRFEINFSIKRGWTLYALTTDQAKALKNQKTFADVK